MPGFGTMATRTDALDLFEADGRAHGLTPIARELKLYLERGGSIDGAVPFVAALERAHLKKVQNHQVRNSSGRGSRLPVDWRPAASDIQFALARGLSDDRVLVEADKFTNYWIAKSGAGATKRDWSATWRNWILTLHLLHPPCLSPMSCRPLRSFSFCMSVAIQSITRETYPAGPTPYDRTGRIADLVDSLLQRLPRYAKRADLIVLVHVDF